MRRLLNTDLFTPETMIFNSLWATGITALGFSALRGHQFVLPASGVGSAVHLSLVARLPQAASSRVREIVSDLRQRNPSHHYYPADTIHLTIMNLDPCVDNDRLELLAQLQDCIGPSHRFYLQGRGLGVSPSSTFLQLFPENRSLLMLRRKVSHLRPVGRGIEPDDFRTLLFRRLAFANLIRFSGPLSVSFVREIARHRSTIFGRFLVETLELVHTDKLFSAESTRTIQRFDLLS
jgi:hypothetical protein